VDARVDMLDEM